MKTKRRNAKNETSAIQVSPAQNFAVCRAVAWLAGQEQRSASKMGGILIGEALAKRGIDLRAFEPKPLPDPPDIG